MKRMIFGFGKKKKRHVVATVLVAVDGEAFVPAIVKIGRTAQRLEHDERAGLDTFAGASQALADTARLLMDHETQWTAAAVGGDVFDSEEDAAAQVAEVFADLSSRYAGSSSEDLPRAAADGTSHERRCVVMLTAAYQGEDADIERELNDRLDLARVLRGLVALHERDALLSAHIHVAPANVDDRLTDEQLLVLFPELTSI